jgi:nitrogen fixation-related uncharacterized protein
VRRSRLAIVIPLSVIALLVGLWLILRSFAGGWFEAPEPQTIAQASLQSMREQARLNVFAARYVAVVTSTQERLGGIVQAQKTMIMPGDVRYELNLADLGQEDISWDEGSNTLRVTLPPIEVSQPQIDINAIQEYSGGGILMRLTDAERALDQANREQGQRSIVEQARQPMPMRLARDSAKRAVARSFALPLRAAGIEANVAVRFGDEPRGGDREYMDHSRRIEDVLADPKDSERQQRK